jgi:hypothetical protein
VAWLWALVAVLLLLFLAYIAWEFRWYWGSLWSGLGGEESTSAGAAFREPALTRRRT